MDTHRLFAQAADPRSLHQVLAESAANDLIDGARVLDVQRTHVQLKAYSRPQSWDKAWARVCYRVRTAQGAATREQIIHGIVRWRGQSQGPATLVSPECEMQLWRFPDDTDFPALAKVLAAPTTTQQGGGDIHMEILNYRPGVRALIRTRPRADTAAWQLYGKVFASAKLAARVHARSRSLHQALAATDDCNSPEPVEVDATGHCLWYRPAHGAPLAGPPSGSPTGLAHATARGLVCLQGLEMPCDAGRSPDLILRDAHKKLHRVALAAPVMADALSTLNRALAMSGLDTNIDRQVLQHGDFHFRQLLWDGRCATLCDLDEVRRGVPERDLATLMIDAGLYGAPRIQVAAWISEFMGHYAGLAPWGIDRTSLRQQLMACSVDKVYRAFTQLHVNLAESIGLVLAHMHDLLNALPPQSSTPHLEGTRA